MTEEEVSRKLVAIIVLSKERGESNVSVEEIREKVERAFSNWNVEAIHLEEL